MVEAAAHLSDLLTGHVVGTLARPADVLVRTHLALNPRHRTYVNELEAIGGVLLDQIEPRPLLARDAALAAIFDAPQEGRIERRPSESDAQETMQKKTSMLPAPLQQFLGMDLKDVPWKTRLPGMREYRIADKNEYGSCYASLLWIRAGSAMPTHTHEGIEMTLVLKGAFRDDTGRYARGDMSIADSEIDHRPVAEANEDCFCYVVNDGDLQLTGPLGRFFAPFVRQ